MTKNNSQNERIKRKYREWVAEARGFNVKTVDQIIRSITMWEQHTKMSDFRDLNTERVKTFKKMISEKINLATKQPLSLTTQHHHLLYLNDFYQWLSLQPGYRQKIIRSNIAYFSLERKQTRIALDRPKRKYPTMEIIKRVVTSIRIENEIDRRDQALMAFAFITGMRIEAITTTPIGCVDMDKLLVSQDPSKNVKTKFSKRIPTTIFNFDAGLTEVVKKWVTFLRSDKLFTDNDPLFPLTKVEQKGTDNYSFIANKLECKFWKNPNGAREVFKKRFKEADVEYFNPHSFRHATEYTALSLCKTPLEFKAVSQNLGHKNIATTMFDYATLSEDDVAKNIKGLTGKRVDDGEEMIERLLKRYNVTPKDE